MYKPPPLLAPLLFIPALMFEAVVRLRDLAYSEGILSPIRLPRPVISIGNLTLGGSGKTPLVIHAARAILGLGHPAAILSRGYGRAAADDEQILPPGHQIPLPAINLGDEPALLRRRVPEAWLGVSPHRHALGREIAKRCPEAVFILDDGFQHQQLHRDLDIVVVDQIQPLLSNHLFPWGSLREPLSGLRRCHAIVLNRTSSAREAQWIESALRRIHPLAAILQCVQKIDRLVPFSVWNESASEDASVVPWRKAFLVAGLGNPERFRKNVHDMGIEAAGFHFFRDHHRLTREDWDDCVRQARRCAAEAIIISEKDAVKVTESPAFPLLVAVQSTGFDRPVEFEQLLLKTIRGIP